MCNCEDRPCCGCDDDSREQYEREQYERDLYNGPGSGEDDLADYNADEADDYADEGYQGDEDSHLDGMYEE